MACVRVIGSNFIGFAFEGRLMMQDHSIDANGVNPIADGMNFARGQGILETLLDPGKTFEEFMIRGGMPMTDALDYAHIYRVGIAFRVPEMVMYAIHAFVASAGSDRLARTEAITGVIGRQSFNNLDRKGKENLSKRFWKKGDPKQDDFDGNS